VHIVDPDSRPLGADREGIGLPGPDPLFAHGVAADAVAEVLGAVEAGAIDRHYRDVPLLLGGPTDGFDVVADQRRNASVIDEDCGGMVIVNRLLDRMKQALFAPAHNDVLLGQVGRHTETVQLRAGGTGATIVPGAAGTGDGAMHDVSNVG